jgi:hypothetical protein
MQTCEKCGVSFEEPDQLVEVTSLRVLCPHCAAERAAAKARKAGPSAPPPAAPPAQNAAPAGARDPARAARSTAPSPASRAASPAPAPRAAPVPASAPTPAPRAAPAPAARSAQPIPARKLEPARAVRAAEPATKTATVASRSKRKPDSPAKHTIDPEDLRRGLQKKGSREMIIAGVVCVVVFAFAGFMWVKVREKKDSEAAAEQAYRDRVETFKTEFRAFEIETEAGARALIAYADENKTLASSLDDFSSEVVGRVAKARTFLDMLARRTDLEQRVNDIEQTLARAAELTPGELAEQRRRLEELSTQAEIGGAEFVLRVANDRQQADQVFFDRLLSAAETAAASPTLDRAALTTIQQSEDELFKLLDISYKAWQKDAQNEELVAKKDLYQEKYQHVVRLSDEAVERFFTPEVIEATPWRDLLAADQAGEWKSDTAKGYERRIENGVMHIIGPDPSEGSEILATIGDSEVWRDFEIDMEFTIAKGGFATYYRVPLVWQDNSYSVDLMTGEDNPLEAGRTYAYTMRILGSTFTDQEMSEDSAGPTTDAVSWTRPRKGAFGIGVAKDTEVKFTRLRARVLR